MARIRITQEQIAAAASKFTSRSEFAKECRPEYQAAWKRGILDVVCAHMSISPIYSDVRWDRASVMRHALKYESRSQFKRECSGAYCHAKENVYLEEVCAHMESKLRQWKEATILAEAEKYSSPAEFKGACRAAYHKACKLGLLDKIRARIGGKILWTKELAMTEARKYKTLAEFRAVGKGAFNFAYRGGFIEEACAHMEHAEYGFSDQKPAVLYFLEVSLHDGGRLCKIGVTNRETRRRISGMGVGLVNAINVVKEIRYSAGRDARMAERSMHRRFSAFRYTGPPVLMNGNTELFTHDVLTMIRN